MPDRNFSNGAYFTNVTTPLTPSSGDMVVYPKADGKLYTMNSSGVESLAGVPISGGTMTGNLGIGIAATSILTIAGGTATAGTSPLKFTSGILLTVPEVGSVEFLTDKFYGTITTGAVRKELALIETGGLTSGRIPFSTTNGRLTDNANLAWDGSTVGITGSLNTSGVVIATGGLSTGTGAGEIDIVSVNGALLGFRTVEVLVSGLSGATATASALIPAGSFVFGVTARVTTAITGATTFTIGDGTVANAWGSSIGIALGTTTSSTNFNITAPTFYAAATNVVLTATGSNFTAGAVRLAVHLIQLSGPTT